MEIFKLLGTIAIENDSANKAIDDTTSKADGAQGKLSTAFSKIGTFAVNAGKVVATGLAAGASAIGALAKTAIDSYSEYEQLEGGVETLFKDSADTIKWYASQAYQTAGMSANEYMSTVTSFSASLLQGLDGDTTKAAEVANRAITDMSDNANKMGTDISMIQNAYQGFAKQNYTMLDNLKLGYGGTASEMARLINESGVLGDTVTVTADTVNSVSFDKIIEAIGVVQDEMGITGTTANEAATTIQGSVSSMKAAWTNLLTAIAYGDEGIEYFLENFVTTVETALKENLIPRIVQVLGGLSLALERLMPVITAQLPAILEQLLPGVIKGATALLTGLISALPVILQILLRELPGIFSQISSAVVKCFPVLLDTFKSLFAQIWDYISLELLNTGVDFETAFTKIKEFFETAWVEIQEVWNSVGQPIFDIVQSAVETVKSVFSEKMPEIKEFVSSCFSDIQTFWENNLKPCFDAIGNFIETVLAPIFDAVFTVAIGGVVDTVFNTIKDLWENTLKPVFTGITDFLTGVFTGNWEQAFNGLLSITSGIWNGIQTAIETPMETAKNLVNNAIEFIKDKFDFEWSFPKLKLPHFNITGSFSLNPPSFPSFGVEWYDKAMDNPMLLKDATLFGESNGKLLGGGESGPEVVSGAATLMGMIGNIVEAKTAAQNEKIIGLLSAILDAILDGNAETLRALLAKQVLELDEREVGRVVRSYA